MKILVPVWGEAYVRRFADLGLASILSPGNLPALAAACQVEFIFLTSADDLPHFEALGLMVRLREHASVRYVAIDDLIVPGLYSVTLTAAYTRGMVLFGEAMTSIHFVYCNADFILGDGALSHVAACIDEGRDVVLAGSVRVVSEVVEPQLRDKVGPDGVLDIPPRPLASFVFQHPHLMQVAKTVNQDFCWARAPNHMFWEVDDATLIARFFQIFMLCLKPTRARASIDGYCDYSFVPAFCPGAPIHVVDDSDRVCLLELQGREQEADDVLFTAGREAGWTRSIAEWCTPEHAEIARQPIVYHAADIPAATSGMIAESGRYIERKLAEIAAPAAHPGHYYWVYGVAAWRLRRSAEMALKGWPPEIEAELPVSALKHPTFDTDRRQRMSSPLAPPRGLVGRMQRLLMGTPPKLTAWHPRAAGLKPLIAQARQTQARLASDPAHRVLVVADLGGWIDRVLNPEHDQIFRTEPLIAATWRLRPEPAVDEVVILSQALAQTELEQVLRNSLGALKPGGRMTLLCHYPSDIDYSGEPALGDQRVFAVVPLRERTRVVHLVSLAERTYARRLADAAAALRDHRLGRRRDGAILTLTTILRRFIGLDRGGQASSAALILSGVAGTAEKP